MQADYTSTCMSDRTTVNVDKPNHRKANHVKMLYDESWPEVLEFYWKHRGNGYMYRKDEPMQDVSNNGGLGEVAVNAENMRSVIREEIAGAMSEVTIDVTIDGDGGDVNEEDVRNIVEAKLDELKTELGGGRR
jgi:hypothetical protein